MHWNQNPEEQVRTGTALILSKGLHLTCYITGYECHTYLALIKALRANLLSPDGCFTLLALGGVCRLGLRG